MTWFIFIGDLVVMAALFGVAAYLFLRANPADIAAAARIPLDDDGDVDNDDSGDGAGAPHA